ncbi:alpha/beta-hydrolase [Camillea tinctor]|nr:alpha/beta-hydrolase [Camillea tinctor]
MSRPVFFLLHGAWHSPPSWNNLIASFNKTGYSATIRNTVSNIVRDHDIVVVVRLIYIAAFLVPEGFQRSPEGTRDNMIEEMKTDFDAGIITVLSEDVKDIFYQDMDDETVAERAKNLRLQSLGAFWSTTTYAAWRYIPTTYILCMRDKPSTVIATEHLINAAKASGINKIDNVIRVDAGHSPFIRKPEWNATTLIEEAHRQG